MTLQIAIVSASAGSGKTYRIAELLNSELHAGRIRPDAILATTFTKSAAAELQGRLRTHLLAHGQAEAAVRIQAARVGTVHAVCQRLIDEFAFELGLSPESDVLDADAAIEVFSRALNDELAGRHVAALVDVSTRFSDFDWRATVASIVESARTNNLLPQQLHKSGERSITEFSSMLSPPATERDLDAELIAALKVFLDSIAPDDKYKTTQRAAERARFTLARLQTGQQVPWTDWDSLSRLTPAKSSKTEVDALRKAAGSYLSHPRLHADVATAVRESISVAIRALTTYDAIKRERGLIDYADQEQKTLTLLERPSVIENLSDQLDVVVVDEFQDTSPIQLAILLKLAKCARSVWVGDQKQAVYGFRGTDPALMDAAINQVLETSTPHTLDKSWRSRAPLVHLTSALFARAFVGQGITESRVRLEPANPDDRPLLGPIVERWLLQSSNAKGDAAAVAVGVEALLTSEDEWVRDPATDEVRRIAPRDVAILARTNQSALTAADALAQRGIPAQVPRTGLLARPEALVVLAGLRLWIDARDALAAAELARLIEFPDREEAFLERVVAQPGPDAFSDLDIIQRLREQAAVYPTAGTLAVFDIVVELLAGRELALSWGDGRQRQANLAQLRAMAVRYDQNRRQEGIGSTVCGLLLHLESLAKQDLDRQATDAEDAVTIATWHSAKGQEWPVVILFDLDWRRPASPLGVHVISDRTSLDLNDPLADRWIRIWPSILGGSKLAKSSPFRLQLDAHAATQAARARQQTEELRLTYVGWTRARDRLILPARRGKLTSGLLGRIADGEGPLITEVLSREMPKDLGEPLLEEPTARRDTKCVWAGVQFSLGIRHLPPDQPSQLKPRPVDASVPVFTAPTSAFAPAFITPSSVDKVGDAALDNIALVGHPKRVGRRLRLRHQPNPQDLGLAVHTFFSSDWRHLSASERRDLITAITLRWGVADAFDFAEFLRNAAAFQQWVESSWPKAVWRREWPVEHRLDGGSVMRGVIDLAIVTSLGAVIIDHKTVIGGVQAALDKVAGFSGQLAAYTDAISAATNRPTLGTFIHLPLSGLVVPVRTSALTPLDEDNPDNKPTQLSLFE